MEKWKPGSHSGSLQTSNPLPFLEPMGSHNLPRVAYDKYRSQNLSVQPGCGIFKTSQIPYQSRTDRQTPQWENDFILCRTVHGFPTPENCLCRGGGSVLELVRDERHLCPGRAEVNTLPRSRLELEQASVWRWSEGACPREEDRHSTGHEGSCQVKKTMALSYQKPQGWEMHTLPALEKYPQVLTKASYEWVWPL